MEPIFVALAALFVIGVVLIFFGRKKGEKSEASEEPETLKQPSSIILETNKNKHMLLYINNFIDFIAAQEAN